MELLIDLGQVQSQEDALKREEKVNSTSFQGVSVMPLPIEGGGDTCFARQVWKRQGQSLGLLARSPTYQLAISLLQSRCMQTDTG